MVRGGHNFKVDYKVDIKRVHRGVTREYFNYRVIYLILTQQKGCCEHI